MISFESGETLRRLWNSLTHHQGSPSHAAQLLLCSGAFPFRFHFVDDWHGGGGGIQPLEEHSFPCRYEWFQLFLLLTQRWCLLLLLLEWSMLLLPELQLLLSLSVLWWILMALAFFRPLISRWRVLKSSAILCSNSILMSISWLCLIRSFSCDCYATFWNIDLSLENGQPLAGARRLL